MFTDFILITQQSYWSGDDLCFEVRRLKTEAQRADVTCPRSHSQKEVWPEIIARLTPEQLAATPYLLC